MSTTSRVTRTWRQGDPWTVTDATELYEIDRWGKGYFSIGPNGHVRVHATQDPERSIDLKQLVDHLQLRGIGLPILIRFRDILRQRLADIHSRVPVGDRAAPVRRQLLLRLSDQGQPAAAGRRGSARLRPAVRLRPRGRVEARAAGRRRDDDQRHADHLQRLQGRRVHRDGDAGPQDGPPHHPGRREIHRARADPRVRAQGRRAAAHRHAREAGRRAAAAAGSRRAATARSSA